MSKPIKFNLTLDNHPARCIEDLQNNFNVEDILKYYENKVLHKWLKVRGFTQYLQEVENIRENKSVIRELIRIFEIETDENKIKESLYALEYSKKEEELIQNLTTLLNNKIQVISEYHDEYKKINDLISERKDDMPFLKATAKEVENKYLKLFELDSVSFYKKHSESAPLMIYAVLMNKILRDSFLKNKVIQELLNKKFLVNDVNKAIDLLMPHLSKNASKPSSVFNSDILASILGSYGIKHESRIEGMDDRDKELIRQAEEFLNKTGLHFYAGKTDSYWKDLKTEETKVMVISVPPNSYIRGAKDKLQEIKASDANGNYLILEGLAYKSNDEYNPIIYMEI